MPIIRRYSLPGTTGIVAISQAADNNTSSYHPIAALTMPNLGILHADQRPSPENQHQPEHAAAAECE